MQRFKQ